MKTGHFSHRCNFFIVAVLVLGAVTARSASGGELPAAGSQTATIAVRQKQDIEILKTCRTGIIAVKQYIAERPNLFAAGPEASAYLPHRSARDDLRTAWGCIFDYYAALDRIAARHRNYRQLTDERQQKNSFQIFRAAVYIAYRHALDFIALVEQNPALDTILNETLPDKGLPSGTYAQFKYKYLNLFKAGEFSAFEVLSLYFGAWEEPVLSAAVENDRQRIWAAGKGQGPALTLKNGVDILERFGRSTWFPVQKEISGWMGETKVHRVGEYLIAPEQVSAIRDRIQPGDILLERREWYMTNLGIPGYWTHAALVVGTPRERIQYFDDPRTTAWVRQSGAENLEALLQASFPEAYRRATSPTETGALPRVIEAIAEGVVFTALESSAACDSLAVLRPRLSKLEKARALHSAFGYSGQPYDYDFDFLTDSSLVCTELIFKAYAPDDDYRGLRLPLEEMMGHMITPANAIARQFAAQYATAGQQMDLVLFIDGNEPLRRAEEADPATFLDSWRRPKWHIFTQAKTMDHP